jgi:serine/threonine-protein kinase
VLDNIYRLDAPLGKGGVGVVFKAWHLHLQRTCAIKFLHPQLVSNPELRTRFRREAQSAFQLGHPHIVAITDFRDDPSNWPYLVMELVQGESLRDRLERGPLEPQMAVRMMAELADALVAAHRRGVIHRDLKPENLLLSTVENVAPVEPDLYLKVLVFGLSKLLDGVEITGTGRLVGSPSYMAPEQARGDSHIVDARSDIWSVGVLLYECLTAEKLFSTDDFETKRQMIMGAKLPPLHFTEKGLPPLIEKIITRCCQRLPEHRYQSASALLSALHAVYPKPAPRLDTLPPGARVMGGVLVLPAGSPDTHETAARAHPSPATTSATPSVHSDTNRSKSSGPEVVVIPAIVKSMLPDTSAASIIKNGELLPERPTGESRRRTGAGIAIALAAVAVAFTGFAGFTLWQSQQKLPGTTSSAGLSLGSATLPTVVTPDGKNPGLSGDHKSVAPQVTPSTTEKEPTRDATTDLQAASAVTQPQEKSPTAPDGEAKPETGAPTDAAFDAATETTAAAAEPLPRPHSPSTLPLRGPRAKSIGEMPTHPLRFGPPKWYRTAEALQLPPPADLPFPVPTAAPAASTPAAPPTATPAPEVPATPAATTPAATTPPAAPKATTAPAATKATTTPAATTTSPARKADARATSEPVTTQEAAGAASAVFRKATGAIGRCFPADVALPTKIGVDVTIAANGKVSEISVEGADAQAACVKAAVKALRFGAISDADNYIVQFDYVNLHR